VPCACSSMPGYSGHIPALVSENIHGRTFRMANEAAVACDISRSNGCKHPEGLMTSLGLLPCRRNQSQVPSVARDRKAKTAAHTSLDERPQLSERRVENPRPSTARGMWTDLEYHKRLANSSPGSTSRSDQQGSGLRRMVSQPDIKAFHVGNEHGGDSPRGLEHASCRESRQQAELDLLREEVRRLQLEFAALQAQTARYEASHASRSSAASPRRVGSGSWHEVPCNHQLRPAGKPSTGKRMRNSDMSLRASSPGPNVPGYAGFRPRVAAENVYGVTWQEATRQAERS